MSDNPRPEGSKDGSLDGVEGAPLATPTGFQAGIQTPLEIAQSPADGEAPLPAPFKADLTSVPAENQVPSQAPVSLPQAVFTDENDEFIQSASLHPERPSATRQPLGVKTDAIPYDVVAGFLSVDSETIAKLPEVVVRQIHTRVHELEALKSQKLLDDVSYEQAVHAANAKEATIKQRLDATLKESQDLRQAVARLEKEKLSVQEQLLASNSATTGSSDVVKSLQLRLETVTNDKRVVMEALERRTGDLRELRDNLEAAQAKSLEARKTIVELENQAQQARAQAMSARLKQQSLEQELELLKRSNEWLDGELKTKSTEYSKYRSEKSTLIAELQAKQDSLESEHSILTKNHQILRSRFDEVSHSYDDALVKVKDLQTSAAVAEESFRSEMSAQQRLTELWEKSAKEAKARVEELAKARDSDRSRRAADMARVKADAEQSRLRAEKLEAQLQGLEGRLTEIHAQTDSGPATPMRLPQTPQRAGTPANGSGVFSPSAHIISQIQKGGVSLVQLYTDYQETRTRLEREQQKNETLRGEMDQILAEMEDNAPAILAEREENRRLELELADLSVQLESATNGAEELRSKFQVTELRYKDGLKENNLLSQQIRDLSRQLQHLLVQQQLEADSEAPLTAQERTQLHELLKAGADNGVESDTQRLISERLVLFKDIIELQKQNESLLRVTRELGQKMEYEESESRKRFENLESAAVADAKTAIERLKDDLKTLTVKSEAVQRERDMFRRMLSNRDGELPTEGGSSNAQVEQLLSANRAATEALSEIRQNFETYKSESTLTIQTLNEQILALRGDREKLQVSLSKVESQVVLAGERAKNSNGNLDMLRSENNELKKRSQQLQEALAKQDIRTQKVADELVDAKSILDSVKNESSNLKAEKSLWKSIEERISKENAQLLEEKGRLNGLLNNVELLATEREAAVKQTEQRFLRQIEALESQVTSLNKRLATEEQQIKTLTDKREVEQTDFQTKIAKLSAELSAAKEQQTGAVSKATTLESQVAALNTKLNLSEQRLKAYQSQGTDKSGGAEELAQLRAQVQDRESQLSTANQHIHELTEVAAAAEKALEEMNDSHDKYMQTTNQAVSAKEAELEDVKGRLQEVSQELTAAQEELNNLKHQETNGVKAIEDEKVRLQAELAALKENETRLETAKSELQKDLERQTAISRDAQENYEKELVKHGEAAATVQRLRTEVSDLRSQAVELSSKAESASSQLADSQASWGTQKYTYEHEIEELKTRCADLSSHNNVLLEQLESVSKRVNNLNSESTDGDNSEHDSSDEKLRDVISYLRREKEIVEVNFELSQQEARRLKQQLDHTVATLDDTKLELEKERQREEDASRISAEHAKVLQQLEDLNVLRESNSSLRSQSKYYVSKAQELETELQAAKDKLEPLESQLRDAVAQSEAKDQQLQLIQEDNNTWKERAQHILQKYQRIDPQELQALKDQVQSLNTKAESLEKERDVLRKEMADKSTTQQSALSALEEKNKELEEKNKKSAQDLDALQVRFKRLRDESQTKLDKRRTESQLLKEELAASTTKVTELTEQLAEVTKQVEALQTSNTDASENNTASIEALQKELEETKQLLAATGDKDQRIADLEAQVNKLSDEALELQRTQNLSGDEATAKLLEDKSTLETKVGQLNTEVEHLRKSVAEADDSLKRIAELEQQLANVGTQSPDDSELQAKLTEAENQAKAHNAALAKAEADYLQKETALKEELEAERQKSQDTQVAGADGTGSLANSDITKLQDEIQKLKDEREKDVQAAAKAARESAMKESDIKAKLLKMKADKAESDKAKLTAELAKLKGEPAPAGTSRTGLPGAGTSKIPTGPSGTKPAVAGDKATPATGKATNGVPGSAGARPQVAGSTGPAVSRLPRIPGAANAQQRPQLQRGPLRPTIASAAKQDAAKQDPANAAAGNKRVADNATGAAQNQKRPKKDAEKQ